MSNGPLTLPRTYIYCQRHLPGDPFRQFLERAQKEGWATYEIDASHSPHITAPEALKEILEKIAYATGANCRGCPAPADVRVDR
jgi:hypothetical protein